MEERILKVEQEIEKIKERNSRVEADKAWEKSFVRIFSLCVITYIIATAVMYMIGVKDFFGAALIPTIGYYLSTLSLSFIKEWWIKKIRKS